nr:unnamed protein product [Digitaria exilis]
MAEESTTSPACPICLEDLEFGNMLSVMPCSHRFHVGCLAKWLALSHRCPCCRHALPVINRDTRPFLRRSSRNRQANVRQFGREWNRG